MEQYNTIRVALPPHVRSAVYLGYSIVGVVLGAILLSYLVLQLALPVWLVVANVVFPFIGTAFGLTAASNTDLGGQPQHAIDEGPATGV